MSILRLALVLGLVLAPLVDGGEVLWEFPTGFHNPQAQLVDAAKPEYLHVALKGGGVKVLHIGGAEPKEVGHVSKKELGGLDAMNLWQEGELLLVALGDFFKPGRPAGLALVNVSVPTFPVLISTWRSPEEMHGSAVVVCDPDRRYAYLGAMDHGVACFDISDRKAPKHLTTFQPDLDFPKRDPNRIQRPNARGMQLKGDRLFVCYDAGGVRVLDVSDPAKPKPIGRYINRGMKGKQSAYNNIHLAGNTAYVAIDYAGVEVLDISEPTRIRQLAWWNPWAAETNTNTWFNSPGHTNQIAYDARRKRLCLSAGDSELVVLDVFDPKKPRRLEGHGEPKNKQGAWGVGASADGEVVYVGYLKTIVPFRGTWSGVRAIRLARP